MTETQLRFLRAIAERMPLVDVVELYLFPPMRQGNTESGIAVIAATIARAVATEADATSERDAGTAAELSAAGMATAGDDDDSPLLPVVPVASVADDPRALACDPTEDASRDAPVGADVPGEGASPVDGASDADEASAAADATVADANVEDTEGARPPFLPVASALRPARERHTVYTARYRLTLKGPERGRWELNIVEEADAPLLTVDLVVRGVQHRAGEGAEPERLEPAALRELLDHAAATSGASR